MEVEIKTDTDVKMSVRGYLDLLPQKISGSQFETFDLQY